MSTIERHVECESGSRDIPYGRSRQRDCRMELLPLENIMDVIGNNNSMQTHFLIGKRNSGKSVLGKHIVENLAKRKRTDTVIAFSNTMRYNRDWHMLKPKNRIEGYQVSKLESIIKFAQKEADKKMEDPSYQPKRITIVLDDIIGMNKETRNCPILDYLFSLGRHINIGVIVISQYPKVVISCIARNNIDFLYMSVNSPAVMALLYEIAIFDGSIHQFRDFITANITQDQYSFVVFNNTSDQPRFHRVMATVRKNRPDESIGGTMPKPVHDDGCNCGCETDTDAPRDGSTKASAKLPPQPYFQ